MTVLHGGQLTRIAKEYNIPKSQWLDLSTGIAPYSYPIPSIPINIWQDLPTITDNLLFVARQYYQAKYCWPLSGSQSLIEKLPELWKTQNKAFNTDISHVYLPKVGYKEHQQAWQKAGCKLHFYQQYLPTDIENNSVVVVINPNNPSNDKFNQAQLKSLQETCEKTNSLLVIDEAFADILSPEWSFVSQIQAQTDNVIVLRSFGKFFGLAGIRIGFVCCGLQWFNRIRQTTGPWEINGPALYIAEQALADKNWHKKQIEKLQDQSQKQQTLLIKYFPAVSTQSNALFMTVFLNNAPHIYRIFCQHGLYVRLTDENDALRFGICSNRQLQQLEVILKDCDKFISHNLTE
ncbi:aminotransferase class I/II-fold pyridoxal phosphate-dependent enzyme [Psychromonas sp. KJ10-10]|uniref:aminotransferase class I/II-fold pyridoxal phosphate-dependent enzyme n=1 Tax=Psychromonas sp. KJ10-10 TaxID=3391823 RepID=UPI0039B4EF88